MLLYTTPLDLFNLVVMKLLRNSFFVAEYKSIHDTHNTCDLYSLQVCRRAFENLLEKQLIMFADGRRHSNGIEFCPVKLLVSSFELEEGLKMSSVCPTILRQWFAHEEFK